MKIRFKIELEIGDDTKKLWYYIKKREERVTELLDRISKSEGVVNGKHLTAKIDGFELIKTNKLRNVIRENDLVTVHNNVGSNKRCNAIETNSTKIGSSAFGFNDTEHKLKQKLSPKINEQNKEPVKSYQSLTFQPVSELNNKVITETIDGSKIIKLPLSLSQSKRKQAIELTNLKRVHLKFADSDEEESSDIKNTTGTLEKTVVKESETYDVPEKLLICDCHINSSGNLVSLQKFEGSFTQTPNSNKKKERSRRGGGKSIDTSVSSAQTRFTRDILKKMKPLSGVPIVNSIIAFKLLQMSDAYTPELSDYKIVRVINYDFVNNSIIVENVLDEPQALGIESDKLIEPQIVEDPLTGEQVRKHRKFEVIDCTDDDLHSTDTVILKPTSGYIQPGESISLTADSLIDIIS